MAQQSATLHTHVSSLATCLEELQQQRVSLLAAAREEESERAQLAANLATVQRRLGQLDASLEKKAAAKEAVDRVIDQTLGALSKLVDSSHMLLTVTRRNAAQVAALGALPGVQAAAAAGQAGQVGAARAAPLSR